MEEEEEVVEREGSWGKGRPVRGGVESGECIGEGKWKDNIESHPRQLIFLRKSDCLGCAVLLCLVLCLTLLASFCLPSHLSLKHDI